jgi:hypothetical protein
MIHLQISLVRHTIFWTLLVLFIRICFFPSTGCEDFIPVVHCDDESLTEICKLTEFKPNKLKKMGKITPYFYHALGELSYKFFFCVAHPIHDEVYVALTRHPDPGCNAICIDPSVTLHGQAKPQYASKGYYNLCPPHTVLVDVDLAKEPRLKVTPLMEKTMREIVKSPEFQKELTNLNSFKNPYYPLEYNKGVKNASRVFKK